MTDPRNTFLQEVIKISSGQLAKYNNILFSTVQYSTVQCLFFFVFFFLLILNGKFVLFLEQKSEKLTVEDMKELRYLECVIKVSRRHHCHIAFCIIISSCISIRFIQNN